MPYELTFTKRIAVVDREQYFNDCCVGGDAVIDELLPVVEGRYSRVMANQEDWGWFIWCRKGRLRLAIDIFTDDIDTGEFRLRLTSRVPTLPLFPFVTRDTRELEELRQLVVGQLEPWVEGPVHSAPADSKGSRGR